MVKEWYAKPRNRFTNFVEPIVASRHFTYASPTSSMGCPGWRGWGSSSPTASYSCSSSENGDEGPITPITPNHPHYQGNVDPFSQAAKENVNPTPTRVKSGPIPNSIRPIASKSVVAVADTNMLYPQRPALLALPSSGDLSAVHRHQHQQQMLMSRRLSN